MSTHSGSIGNIAYDSYFKPSIKGSVAKNSHKTLDEVEVEIAVNRGDAVKVSTHFALRGQIYPGIKLTGGDAEALTPTSTVFVRGSGWSSFSWTVLFQATNSGKLSFAINLANADVDGSYTIYQPILTAEVVALDPLADLGS